MYLFSVLRDMVTISLMLLASLASVGAAQSSYVASAGGVGRFPLAANGAVAPLVVSDSDFPGVVRAARDLRSDLAKVTGSEPRFSSSVDAAGARTVVIVGTIGRSPFIDALVRAGKLDVGGVRGRWETWVTQPIDAPMPGVDHALVIAGSDKRGTIYGIYDLSSEIGVSPWTWWADVPVRRRNALYVLPGRHSDGEPAVKYRGIFLNDEAPALSGWVHEKFGGFNHQFYEKVFELILRLKGNYLWPAMWANAFNDDDTLNPVIADEYGVVMGTSHHEPMLRAQQEWKRYGHGEWNYATNDSVLRAFWTQGIRNMDHHESIVTIGMRGDGDMPMTTGSNVDLLERIVADQRRIIAQVTGKPASDTPQLWALYKEVQDYYDKGMRVPDDVTLLFSDGNWGNIRRVPALTDSARAGGFGIYYHFDYVGGPRNYKWINTNPIARVWEQMHLAYAYHAKQIWIVNVGDLKPMEYPISFFLDYAWNPSRWPAERLPDYARQWAAQQFGAEQAADIADVITTTLEYAGRRKPELLDTATYSLTNFDEAERVVAQYDTLERRAEAISRELPAQYRDAYYELVLHPVEAAANLNRLYVTVAKNRLDAREGRVAANALADSARALFGRDAAITRYYNTQLAGGKWDHMMDQTHIGYTYWQEPPRNTMPRVDVIQVPKPADMGVAIVEQNRAVPTGRGRFAFPPPGAGRGRELALPTFDPYERQTYHLDVYDRGTTPFAFTASAAEPWVRASPASGTVTAERRLSVSIDWAHAPNGEHRVPITITRANGNRVVVNAVVSNPVSPARESVRGFVESGGYVSMDAAHYSRAFHYDGVYWLTVPGLGRTGSAVTTTPVTSPSERPGGNGPSLEYDVFMFDSGSVKVHAYLSPTLNFTGSPQGLRYAVSFDDEPPQIVNIWADTSNRAWEKAVADNVIVPVTQHVLAHPGAHVLKFWMVDPGVVLQKIVIEAKPLPDSYLGPPESYHRLSSGAAAPGGLAPTTPMPPRAGAPVARFDWFEYDGHDSVFARVHANANQYLNPILAGFYPDPSITRVGSDYYLVTSSFAYYPGVPIFRSSDLVHWTQIGSVIDRPSQLNLDSAGITRGIFAPQIRYHDGTYYVITTLVDRGGNFIVTATNPAGPWSDPVWLPQIDGIDPSLFFDDDGRAWVLNNGPPIGKPLYEGHRAIWIQEYNIANKRLVGPRSVIVNGGVDLAKHPIWIEAPHILEVAGKYYLICAEGGTAEQHSEVVFRSDSVTGPYVPYAGNPILTQRQLDPRRPFPITSTGHADFVETPGGEWWAVFLGVRPYMGDHYNNGRETYLLPVTWSNGWPVILAGNATVPYVHARPALPRASVPAIPTTGNFRLRDEFDSTALAPYWNVVRTPREQWFDLTSSPGALSIRARPVDLASREQPSFIARRQQHEMASASTAVHFRPVRDGDEAGLAALQSETYHYTLTVARTADTTVVQVKMRAGERPDSVIARVPVRLVGDRPVELRIDDNGARSDFYYALSPGHWIPLLRGADGTVLSSKRAGGFVGTMLGMYAYSAPR